MDAVSKLRECIVHLWSDSRPGSMIRLMSFAFSSSTTNPEIPLKCRPISMLRRLKMMKLAFETPPGPEIDFIKLVPNGFRDGAPVPTDTRQWRWSSSFHPSPWPYTGDASAQSWWTGVVCAGAAVCKGLAVDNARLEEGRCGGYCPCCFADAVSGEHRGSPCRGVTSSLGR